MNKRFALLLILILTASSLIVVKPTHSSIPKPSVPEFTLKFVDSSYNVTTTDPYTGVDVTQQFDNNTIEIMIKNQPFTYSKNGLTYHLYYNVRTKPHFVGDWTERYPVVERTNSPYDWENESWSYSKYLSDNSPPQSNSDYTVISYALGDNAYYLFRDLPSNAQIDFQVEAIVGHDSQRWVIEHPLAPRYGGYYEPAIAYDTTSGWSNTQTLIIDITPPAIYVVSPENKTYTMNNVSLTFAVNETVSWIGYSLDAQDNVTITGNITLTKLSYGSHNLTVYAKDTAGKTGTSETIYFSITQREPFPATWIAAAIVIIAVVGVAFLVYFRKIRKTTGKTEIISEGVM